MGIVSMPVRLTLPESSAVALSLAADDMAGATSNTKFLAALDGNHRLWLSLSAIARINGWGTPDSRISDFVMATTRKAGRQTGDDQIETLITINRDMALRLVDGHDLDAIQRRAMLAWQERGRPYGLIMDRWLIAEMERKARIH